MVSFLTGGVRPELLNTSNLSRRKPSAILPLCTGPNLAIFPDFSTRLPEGMPCRKRLSKYMLQTAVLGENVWPNYKRMLNG